MKKCISMLLAVFLLLGCFAAGIPTVHAASKPTESRAIGLVFDNSGSMYGSGNSDWCKATYAMEVFASMLNPGDVLFIYPMNPIEVGGQAYDMNNPFKLTDASQADKIRQIKTPRASLTPIESVDSAYNHLKSEPAPKKYLIVLSDGTYFHKNNKEMSKDESRRELDARFGEIAGPAMNAMFLGIGSESVMPNTADSTYFMKKQAKTSADVLSVLTEMCNLVFGRDTLPSNHKNGTTVDFDISMRKLIVFVQGENVSDLKVTGASGLVGAQVSSASTKYSETGCDNKDFAVDSSLQGMMVTYENCSAGQYNIEFSGNATSIEVYYEPDADLAFVFTDANGNTVDPNALYEGTYVLSYGLLDAKTGKLSSSDLLVNPSYSGSYTVNGQKFPFDCNGYTGQTEVELKKDDTFDANLTVRYLGGYTISKDSSDFGWPAGGITVAPRPAGNLELKISGGQSQYSLQELEGGAPFIAELFYEGNKLSTGDYQLTWDAATSNALIEAIDKGDHYELKLHYRDASNPQNTGDGDCTVQFKTAYTPQGSNEVQAQAALSYNILNDFSPLQISLFAPDDYIVISELGQSQPITVTLTLKGAKLTAEEFARVPEPIVNTNGIKFTMTPAPEQSAYIIQLLETEGIAEDDYPITVKAVYTDSVGQTTEDSDELVITLSALPLWLKWVIGLALLLLLILIIVLIMHIKVLPKYAHISKRDSKFLLDGEDQTKFASFQGSASDVMVKLGGNKFGLAWAVKPGKESYLYKKQTSRYAEMVNPATIKRMGNATIERVTIGSIKYELNENGVLERKPASKAPLNLKHGMNVIYSGTINSAGIKKSFNINLKLNFKK